MAVAGFGNPRIPGCFFSVFPLVFPSKSRCSAGKPGLSPGALALRELVTGQTHAPAARGNGVLWNMDEHGPLEIGDLPMNNGDFP